MEFNALLDNLLQEHNKSRADLSKEAGIPYTTICGWINAGRLPDYNSIIKLAKYFNVSSDYILGMESEYGAEETESSHDEKALLRTYRQMSEERKRALLSMLDIQ